MGRKSFHQGMTWSITDPKVWRIWQGLTQMSPFWTSHRRLTRSHTFLLLHTNLTPHFSNFADFKQPQMPNEPTKYYILLVHTENLKSIHVYEIQIQIFDIIKISHCNSIANALELRLSCTKPSISWFQLKSPISFSEWSIALANHPHEFLHFQCRSTGVSVNPLDFVRENCTSASVRVHFFQRKIERIKRPIRHGLL